MKRHYTIVLAALLLAMGIAVAAVASQPVAHSHRQQAPQARTCFPAAKWDGEDGYRPCVKVLRVEEDGSFRFRVSDAGGIDSSPTERYVSAVGALDR